MGDLTQGRYSNTDPATLLRLVDASESPMFWMDATLCYRGCNTAYADLMRIGTPESIVGLRDEDLPWSESSRAAKREREERVLRERRADLRVPVSKSLSDGTEYEMLTTKTPIVEADGRLTGVASIYTDITEVTRLRGHVQSTEKLVAIGRLAAGIAHEINTPVQSALLNLDYLMKRADVAAEASDEPVEPPSEEPPEPGASVEVIREVAMAIDRVREIVSAMGVISHPGSDTMGSVNINSLVRSAAAISRHRWKHAATLDLDLADNNPTAHGNAGQLSQVLLNLIVNAADAVAEKHSGAEQSGRIAIRTKQGSKGVRIDVEDNGVGIRSEIMERMFEGFYTTKEIGKGTGQGLAIARDVIENRHGGTLLCKSVVDSGTTFQIVLPDTGPE